MKPTEKFRAFVDRFVTIEEGYTTVYVVSEEEANDDSVMWIVESYHPMEFLDDGQEVVALSYSSSDRDHEPIGFIAVSDEEDLCWVYEDGNDEPLPTPASELTLSPVD